ncbi:MAG: hypothetical protein M3450_06130 [Actinomycetota bacterium]|nr:hypothetical protein [Actinomycetota bacterium]
MTLKNLIRRKALLPVVLLAAAVGVTTAAGADDARKPVKSERDTGSVMRDVREGRATKVGRPGPARRTTAVWTGCHFVYLTTEINDYRFDDGSVARVSENPDPMPPRDCVGPDRNPTEGELNASNTVVAARNAGDRAPGAENRPLPPEPRPKHLDKP